MRNNVARSQLSSSLLELGGCEAAFIGLAATAAHVDQPIGGLTVAAGITGLAFWWGLQIGTPAGRRAILQPAVVGIGMALLVQSVVGYSGISSPMSLEVLVGGCLGATLLAMLLRRRVLSNPARPTILMLGCGAVGSRVLPELGSDLMGVLETDPRRVPAGTEYLGPFAELAGVMAARHPDNLILDGEDWEERISPRFLLDCKLEGKGLETAVGAYERLFQRILVEQMQWVQSSWPETLRSNRQVMALQAVYSNLIGLGFLVSLAPILVVLGVAARLAAGPGPVFENVTCCGFQRVPFAWRRFRIHKAATGEKTGIGKMIARLRLTNLPQLINVVRGEMGLFGPKPVLLEFANYLETLSPIYSYRFCMKPGIFGWAQVHAGLDSARKSNGGADSLAAELVEENLRIGYDLYYLECGSPFMDLEILRDTIVRRLAWTR